MIYKITTSYDPDGNYDEGYKELHKKIIKMKQKRL